MLFQVEDWANCIDEMKELFPMHWNEVADKRIPLDVWYEAYDEMRDQMHVVTVRDAGKLVGYFWAVVRPHLHYKQSLTAYTDIYFLHPLYRKGWNGFRLIKYAVASLKARGVQRIYIASKKKLDMSLIFERLNFTQSEVVYTLVTGE